MSAEHHDEPEQSIRLGAEWIVEAINELSAAVTEDRQIGGMAALIRAVERCAAALEKVAGELGLIRLLLEEMTKKKEREQSATHP